MTNQKVWDRPICPHCDLEMLNKIAGIGKSFNHWVCMGCDYEIEDTIFEEIKTENEQTKISMATTQP